MRNFLESIRSRVFAGILFLVPVFAIIMIVQKLWKTLTGAGNYLVQTFGLKSLLGSSSVPIVTAVLLILVCYLFGWLVKFSMLTKFRDWIEHTILQYIPGYLTYRAQIVQKIKPAEDARVPVLVKTATGKKPGFLIEELADDVIIFFPNSPDSNNGEVMVVAKQEITRLNINAEGFIKSMRQFGKGLVMPVIKPVSHS
jgi:uncharacterized membrane protein